MTQQFTAEEIRHNTPAQLLALASARTTTQSQNRIGRDIGVLHTHEPYHRYEHVQCKKSPPTAPWEGVDPTRPWDSLASAGYRNF